MAASDLHDPAETATSTLPMSSFLANCIVIALTDARSHHRCERHRHVMFDAALYANTVATLDDDEPRLVYADWLLQRGDPRGEMFVVQIGRARADSPELAAREAELWAAHRQAWCAPYDAGMELEMRRGFFECARATVPELVASRAALETEAVRELHIRRYAVASPTDDPSTVVELVTGLPIQSLGLQRHVPDYAAIAARLPRLEHLRLDDCSLEGIAAMSTLPALTVRELRQPALDWLAPFASMALVDLTLEYCRFGDIAPIVALPSLRRLDLRLSRITGADLSAICELSLEALDLSETTIRARDVAIVAHAPALRSLRRLAFNGTTWGKHEVCALVASPFLSHQLALDLRDRGDLAGLQWDAKTGRWVGEVTPGLDERFELHIDDWDNDPRPRSPRPLVRRSANQPPGCTEGM